MAPLQPAANPESSRVLKVLCTSGLFMLVVYAAICWFSFDCEQSDPNQSRPLLLVVGLFTAAGISYLFVCWQAIWRNLGTSASVSCSRCMMVVLGMGVLFRLILLFSVPIQEVDLFRYIWDGTVISEGISPYEYSPQEVELYPTKGVPNYRTTLVEREDLARLSKIATSPGMDQAFPLVHFENYTTPYPLINQAPFALASMIGRTTDSFWGLLFAMKGVLVLFDCATALLLIGLLKRLALPTIWVVAYLWCPLVIKEIANSGHLDSVVVFLTTAAVYLMVTMYWKIDPPTTDLTTDPTTDLTTFARVDEGLIAKSCLIGVVLASAVAAKLFPVVLGPIWAVLMWKRIKFASIVPLVVFAVVTAVLLWPMVGKTQYVRSSIQQVKTQFFNHDGQENQDVPKLKAAPPAGIEAFVKYWEMNDFIFMILVENLKPYGDTAKQYAAANEDPTSKVWFVKTSNELRHAVCDFYAQFTGVPKRSAAFSLTRRTTLVVFFLIVLWTCVRVWRNDEPLLMLEMVFLTIAWFWLLAPTQNPWYWTWAMPWLVFCRNRTWFVVSVVAMAYYLRFFFEYHGIVGPDQPGLIGTPYAGTAFFDYIFPVLEFGPILLALFLSWIMRPKQERHVPKWPVGASVDVPNPLSVS